MKVNVMCRKFECRKDIHVRHIWLHFLPGRVTGRSHSIYIYIYMELTGEGPVKSLGTRLCILQDKLSGHCTQPTAGHIFVYNIKDSISLPVRRVYRSDLTFHRQDGQELKL